MSNLLEQAIIDAAALKEVAMKNAEAALIEKYSREFKESVEKLLEQEEAAAIADPIASMPPADASAMPTSVPPSDAEEAFSDVASSFLDGEEDEVITIDFDQLKKQISNSLMPQSPILSSPEMDLTGDAGEETEAGEEEEQTSAEMNENLEEMYDQGANSSFSTDALDEESWEVEEDVLVDPLEKKKRVAAGLPAEESDESEEEQEEYEESLMSLEEFELEEGSAEQIPSAEQAVGTAQKRLGDLKAAAAKEDEEEKKKISAVQAGTSGLEEDIEITQEELEELAEQIAEELKVDIDVSNLSDGHMGTTQREKREQRNLEFAEARDAEETEKRKQEEAEMADLKKQLDEAIEVGASLVQENDELNEKMLEMQQNLDILRENIEKLSISNAKLLYTNKVLGNSSLNERQKQQIVENISKSTSVLEAKTIYNTLQSAVSGINTNKPKESLSEALIRGNSPFITRKKEATELPMAERMKKLAGIT